MAETDSSGTHANLTRELTNGFTESAPVLFSAKPSPTLCNEWSSSPSKQSLLRLRRHIPPRAVRSPPRHTPPDRDRARQKAGFSAMPRPAAGEPSDNSGVGLP